MDTNAKKIVYGRVYAYTECIMDTMRKFPRYLSGDTAYWFLVDEFAKWAYDIRHRWTDFLDLDRFEQDMYEMLLSGSRIDEDDVEARYEEIEEEEAADDED
jgi:hypothetical protein